jgi:hypothetical protein
VKIFGVFLKKFPENFITDSFFELENLFVPEYTWEDSIRYYFIELTDYQARNENED